MSYILDALNKSEKERERKKVPGLSRIDAEAETGSLKPGHWIAIVLLILLINGGGLILLFGDQLFGSDSPAVVDRPVSTTPPAVTQPQASEPAPVATAEQSADAIEETRPLTLNTTQSTPAPQPVLLPVTELSALPGSVRGQLPALDITTHIYASDSELRMVKVNDIERREGDQLAPMTRLVEITETGVVIAFRQYQYRLNVVEDWQL